MAVIQCTATASGKTASCSITVEQASYIAIDTKQP